MEFHAEPVLFLALSLNNPIYESYEFQVLEESFVLKVIII